MFGTLRTLLAVMVLVGHLTNQWQIGTYAVFAFYIISGYLMTHIMHDSYGFTVRGRKHFVVNRFIRLYPGYWAVLALSIVIILFVGKDYARQYNELIYLPQTLEQWLSVLSMLYIAEFPNKVAPNLAPTTWAITVELFFYTLICAGISKTRKRVAIWLAISFTYVAYCQVANISWPYKYFPIPAASLPFAIGAFIYFRKKDGYPSISDLLMTAPATLTLLLVANAIITLVKPEYFQTGFYVSFFISILLCHEIAMGRSWPWIRRTLDKAIGDYSYPIYLMHWQIGLLVCFLFSHKPVQNNGPAGYLVTLVSLLVCLVLSAALIRYVDKPLQSIKAAKIRNLSTGRD